MNITWAAYHANLQLHHKVHSDIGALLPLFREDSKSPAMIKHSINVIKKAVQFLNSNQIPVIAFDQPLYAIAKQIQWKWYSEYGENQVVVMMGGLHVEMVMLKVIGNWLEDTGWSNVLCTSEVAEQGTANSFIWGSHVSKTRKAHQITACALYSLMKKAYINDETSDDFHTWRRQKESLFPQFKFWSITLNMQLVLLLFVRSLRTGNFDLYKLALRKILPWLFALDHTHYARWLPVHLQDMLDLETSCPSVFIEFNKGSFVVSKTKNKFSSIAIDHAHEQNNKCVKGDGGAIGLTEDSSQLLRWMMSGPELARLVAEFDDSINVGFDNDKNHVYPHHEQTNSKQKKFEKDVNSVIKTIEELGSPFIEDSQDLLVLDSRNIASDAVKHTINIIEKSGEQQYKQFVEERLVKKEKSLSDPIPRNKHTTFSSTPSKKVSSSQQEIKSLKNSVQLFSQLYIASQVRSGDLNDFFRHENQEFPPSLTDKYGRIRSGDKSILVKCLETTTPSLNLPPDVDAIILEGSVLVNQLKPGLSSKFSDYAKNVFLPYVKRKLQNTSRVDVVWDKYVPNSLKTATRDKRGKGIRRRVEPDSRVPGNWEAFLRIDENKTELFKYLAEEIINIDSADKQVITTYGEKVLMKIEQNSELLEPCNHEEADTRLFVHAADASNQRKKRVMICTVDTDVVVIALAMFDRLDLDELWISYGVGKHLRYLPIHTMHANLGPEKSKAILMFHPMTGCDQVSFLAGRSKKTSWDTWQKFEDITSILERLSNAPSKSVVDEMLPDIERFIILIFDRTSTCTKVDQCRQNLFTKKGRSIENIPPTCAALYQHIIRSVYQAGYVWNQATRPQQILPSPTDWGWTQLENGSFQPVWSTLPEASSICRELIKCGCSEKLGCRGHCKCKRATLKCTGLCNCEGNCDN